MSSEQEIQFIFFDKPLDISFFCVTILFVMLKRCDLSKWKLLYGRMQMSNRNAVESEQSGIKAFEITSIDKDGEMVTVQLSGEFCLALAGQLFRSKNKALLALAHQIQGSAELTGHVSDRPPVFDSVMEALESVAS